MLFVCVGYMLSRVRISMGGGYSQSLNNSEKPGAWMLCGVALALAIVNFQDMIRLAIANAQLVGNSAEMSVIAEYKTKNYETETLDSAIAAAGGGVGALASIGALIRDILAERWSPQGFTFDTSDIKFTRSNDLTSDFHGKQYSVQVQIRRETEQGRRYDGLLVTVSARTNPSTCCDSCTIS